MNKTVDASKQPLCVGLVGPLPPPSGGMANQTRQLMGLLRQEGVQVDLVQVNAPYSPGWIGRIRWIRALWRFVPYIYRLWRVAGRVNIFHVMANSWWSWHLFAAPAIWIAWVRSVPVVINYRGGDAEAFFRKSFRFVRPTLNAADAIIVPSRFLEEVFSKFGVVTLIVPNIINLDRFKKFSESEVLKPHHYPHIIVTRNLESIYDIPTALQAFQIVKQKYPSARLSVTGSGPQRKRLEVLAESLYIADAVLFTGRLDVDEIANLYKSADLMVNSSTVDNMPNSILEAMASGVPIVSTNVGGIPYLICQGKSGILVPPRDSVMMADAILRVLQDSDLAKTLIKTGYDVVSKYSWKNVKQQLFSVYARVLKKSSFHAQAWSSNPRQE